MATVAAPAYTWATLRQRIDEWFDEKRKEYPTRGYCQHTQFEYRREYAANKVLRLRSWCTQCRRVFGNVIKKTAVPCFEDVPILTADEIAESNSPRVLDEPYGYDHKQKVLKARFDQYYREYMASDAWKEKRQRVIRRCQGICEGCGVDVVHHIHHTTYDHLGDELLFELRGLCRECHNKIHPHREFV